MSIAARAGVHAALGDVARLAIVDRLMLGDCSPGEIARLLGLPTNLVAHHLGVLEAAGLLRRTPSEGDRRRTYLRLVPARLAGLLHPQLIAPPRLVFVCTHNSARSQLAAALFRQRSAVPATSAGTEPAGRIHPRAVRVARRHGLDLNGARPVHVDDVLESLHLDRPGLHWSVPDPAPIDTDKAFEDAFVDIATRIDRLVPTLQEAHDD
jgi:protein-tyrosine-phosphatase